MRAALLTEFNKPWAMKEIPDPRPAEGQVLMRIEACGMCGTDLHVHHGMFPLTPPIVAGHEPVGRIVEIGPGVMGLRVGDRVGVHWVQRGCGRCRTCVAGKAIYCAEQQSWMELGGGNAELMLAWADGCTRIPENVRSEDAAPIFCAGFTVMSGLRNADPKPGERVAILGVGGLGHLALQFARALGLETVAVTGQESKRAELRELGADDVVVTDGKHVGQALLAAGGADVILSTTNSAEQISQAALGLRPEGRLVGMGLAVGPFQPDLMDFMIYQKKLIGSTQHRRSDLLEALDLVASGKVAPKLEIYPLDKVNEVRDRLEAGKVRYRAVLLPARS